MKKFLKACWRELRKLSPAQEFGLIALAGALAGLPMLKIPEFCDSFGPLALAMLAGIGIVCIEFGEIILPSKPTDKPKE